jgi:hypothetical protein
VNDYLKEITGQDITAKDFRTWAGTVLAAMALNELESFDSAAQAKRNLRAAIEKVSGKLGNTPTICRKCYVHPEVLNSYMDGNRAVDPRHRSVFNLLLTRVADQCPVDRLPGLRADRTDRLLEHRLLRKPAPRQSGKGYKRRGILQMKRQLPGYFKILNVYGRALVSRQHGSVELLFRAGVDPIA